MAYSFDPKAPFLGGIAGLNLPGSTGATDAAFGGALNVAPLTPGFTGTNSMPPLPSGVDPNLGFMMNWQKQQQDESKREFAEQFKELTKQRQAEAKEAFTWKTLGQIPNTIASIGQGLAATLYNPASVEIASRTPGSLAGIYAQDLAGSRKKYIS